MILLQLRHLPTTSWMSGPRASATFTALLMFRLSSPVLVAVSPANPLFPRPPEVGQFAPVSG
ncbi:MAG: hypothetical protein DI597_14475 [Pseudoxanthomonas spadix]|nr:MAG: hypothetical protein DI597_14475 [Pseudoxanthomonas spadix]